MKHRASTRRHCLVVSERPAREPPAFVFKRGRSASHRLRHGAISSYLEDISGVVARAETASADSSINLARRTSRWIGENRLAGDSASAWGTPSSRYPQPRRQRRGLRGRVNARGRTAHGLAGRRANVWSSTSKQREGLDRFARPPSLDQSDAPSGSPIHCCRAPLEVICRSIRNRFREEKGMDP